MRHSIRIVLLSALSAAAVCSSASAQTTLRYQFTEGEKLQYEMEQKSVTTRSVMNMEVQAKMTLRSDLVWHVVAVNRDGSAQVQIKVMRARMTLDDETGMFEVDSMQKDEPDDPVRKATWQQVKAMAAMELTGVIQPTGALDLKAADKTLEAMKKLPGGEGFNPEMFKAMVGNVTFPTAAVTKGKTWANKHEIKSALAKMTIENTYTYEGAIAKDGAKLEKMSLKPDVKIEPAKDAPIKEIKETRGSGQILFDNTKGRVVEAIVNQYVQMEGSFAGMNFQITSDQTTTVRLKK